MNAPHAATELLYRQHHTPWARVTVSGQTTNRRSASSIVDGRAVDAPCLRVRTDAPLSSVTDLGTLEKKATERAMRDTDGNKVRAAKQLGISRMQLYTRLRKFGFGNT